MTPLDDSGASLPSGTPEQAAEQEMGFGYRGTLKVLVCARPDAANMPLEDAVALAWIDPPDYARWARELVDLDLGDYDCDTIPSFPPDGSGGGLWVLSWEYQITKMYEDVADAENDRMELTAKYAPDCVWTRPTIDDLKAFGVLPNV